MNMDAGVVQYMKVKVNVDRNYVFILYIQFDHDEMFPREHHQNSKWFPIHPAAIIIYQEAVTVMVCGVSKYFKFMTGVFSGSPEGSTTSETFWLSEACERCKES